MKQFVLRPILLTAIAAFSAMSTLAVPLKVGQPFPNVLLPSLQNGQPASIRDFAGQKLMLHLFASW